MCRRELLLCFRWIWSELARFVVRLSPMERAGNGLSSATRGDGAGWTARFNTKVAEGSEVAEKDPSVCDLT